MSPAPKSSFPYYICTTSSPGMTKSSFPYYICTTNWPLLSPAPKSSFPYYILYYKLATSDISPAFRAFDARDLRRGLRRTNPTRNLTCISRPQHARSPQRAARDKSKTPSHLHLAPSTHTISAEGLRRTLTCISRPRHARSPQRVAPD